MSQMKNVFNMSKGNGLIRRIFVLSTALMMLSLFVVGITSATSNDSISNGSTDIKRAPIEVGRFTAEEGLSIPQIKKAHAEYVNTIKVVKIEVDAEIPYRRTTHDGKVVDDTKIENISMGTGFLLPNGYIVTNDHVAKRSYEGSIGIQYKVSFYRQVHNWEYVTGEIVAFDTEHDLSILKIDSNAVPDTYRKYAVTQLNTSYNNNDSIEVIGHPSKPLDEPLVVGNINGKEFSVDHIYYNWERVVGTVVNSSTNITTRNLSDGGESALNSVIQLDAKLYPGNSGSPVFNSKGDVIGVAVAGSANTSRSYAVRSEDLIHLIADSGLNDTIFGSIK